MSINENEIDWNNPDAVEAAIWIPVLNETWEWVQSDLDAMCNQNCSDCMKCPIDDIWTKLSAILCCPSHPETKEVDPETWACPNYNMLTGECRVYQTDEYPSACENYHCKTHGR